MHFFGHAEVGARMFDKLEPPAPALRAASPRCRRRCAFSILHHLRANQYEGDWTDSAVRRFAREMGEHLDDLLCLSRADITTKRPEKKKRGLEQISELAERIRTLAAEDAVIPPLPGGHRRRDHEGVPAAAVAPDRRGQARARSRGRSREIASHLESEAYVQFLSENKARFGVPGIAPQSFGGVQRSPKLLKSLVPRKWARSTRMTPRLSSGVWSSKTWNSSPGILRSRPWPRASTVAGRGPPSRSAISPKAAPL